jgi:hypothetical protein
MCESQDLTLHTMLSDVVATVRPDPLQGILSVIACYRQVITRLVTGISSPHLHPKPATGILGSSSRTCGDKHWTGVKIVHARDLDTNTAQTPGMTRAARQAPQS